MTKAASTLFNRLSTSRMMKSARLVSNSNRVRPPTTKPTARLAIPPSDPAPWVVFAHFCGVSRSHHDVHDPTELPSGIIREPGQHLADYVLEYSDGAEHRQAIRRRYEVNDLFVAWGQLAFAAHPHRRVGPTDLRGPHRRGEWGRNQMAIEMPVYDGDMEPWPHRRPIGNYWLYASYGGAADFAIYHITNSGTYVRVK